MLWVSWVWEWEWGSIMAVQELELGIMAALELGWELIMAEGRGIQGGKVGAELLQGGLLFWIHKVG